MNAFPRKKRRRKKSGHGKARLVRTRFLNHELVGVRLGEGHKVRGSPVGGFRVARAVGALWDRRRRQVVELVVRLLGGRDDVRGGFNGPKLRLRNRREFAVDLPSTPTRAAASALACSVRGIHRGSQVIPVDAFVQGRRDGTYPALPAEHPLLKKPNGRVH